MAVNMDDLTRLKAKRTGTKQSASRARNLMETELGKPSPDFASIQGYLRILKKKEETLTEINEQMEPLFTTAAELEKDQETSQDYIDDLVIAQCRGNQAVDLHKQAATLAAAVSLSVATSASTSRSSTPIGNIQPPGNLNAVPPGIQSLTGITQPPGNRNASGSSTSSSTAISSASSSSPTTGTAPAVRLPKLEIRRFSGKISEWQNFWANFGSSIHNNPNLGKTDKFSYLLSYLEGSALKSVDGLSLSDANYDAAITTLEARFGRKEIIISEHMNNLLNLPAVRKSSDLLGLRRLHDSCMTQIRSLQDLQVIDQNYGSLLCPIITQRLPEDITLAFSRKYASVTQLQINDLMTFLQLEIASRERASVLTRSNESDRRLAEPDRRIPERPPQPRDSRYDNRRPKPPYGAAALSVNADIRACLYCSKTEHSTTQCNQLTVSEKKALLIQKKRCFICLRERHQARECNSRFRNCMNCKGRHHTSICDKLEASSPEDTPQSNANRTAQMTAGVSKKSTGAVFLQTALAIARSPNGSNRTTVRCLLDTGSHVTFIKEKISRELRLPILNEESLETTSFGSTQPERKLRRKVRLELRSRYNPEKRLTIEAYETPEICGSVFSVPGSELALEFQRRNLCMADATTVELGIRDPHSVDILIGADYLWAVASGKFERFGPTLTAMETIFGWTLQGPATVGARDIGVNAVSIMLINATSQSEEETVSNQLRGFWELESFGVHDLDEDREAGNKVLEKFTKTTVFKDDRYTVALPFKPGTLNLGDNYAVAAKRTSNLLFKLRKDPISFNEYNTIIRDQITAGIVEKVNPTKKVFDPLYYLPHRAVIREASTSTRTRVVYDASSHAADTSSLNACLESGPKLNPELFDILLRFRERKIAFTADITKAFLQIEIRKEDRDALRFLWVDVDDPYKSHTLRTYRLTRVPFGATSSPFLLAATIRLHAKKYHDVYPEASQLLDGSLYVDDLVANTDTEEEAVKIIDETNQIMQHANMKLTKWQSNSPGLRQYLAAKNPDGKPENVLPFSAPPKVLGLTWDSTTDALLFEIKELLEFVQNRQNSKRWVLKSVAKVFDPLGFLAPFTVRAKLLFQKLWENGQSWDEPLPNELSETFEIWCNELRDLTKISVPRYYFHGVNKVDDDELEIHCFSDASPKAYAAVAYFRYRNEGGSFSSNLITAKSRVAPLKKLTLPRLELMGALLAAKLVNHLRTQLKIKTKKIFMWSDSQITLGWIKGSADRWKPFIANRVREIQTISNPMFWHHCKGTENPADLPTRGCKMAELAQDNFWWHGPNWLQQEIDRLEDQPAELNLELVQEEARSTAVTMTIITPQKESPFNIRTFSSLKNLYRHTAWILRYLHNLRFKMKRRTGELDADEIQLAEQYWIRVTQEEQFPEEIKNLSTQLKIPQTSKILTLHPRLDPDGLLRISGRLQGSGLSHAEQQPYLLAPNHPFTELVIKNAHEKVMHAGVVITTVSLRNKFWIIKSRNYVSSVLRSCNICKYFRTRPSNAVMAPLPEFRTTQTPVFESTGLDFAGPLYTRDGKKCYVALFTCAVTRAVHLELVSDQSTDTFLLALRRFISRRGMVKHIHSDNAKTFKRAKTELTELWENIDHPKVAQYFSDHRIKWTYICDRAAWWGGYWERLVGSVKNALRKTIGRAKLSFEEITTTLTEAEAAINSRPITFVSEDPNEPTPLTPNHFLIGDRATTLPSRKYPNITDVPASRKELTRRLRYRQTIIEGFWKRWRAEYLLQLRSAHHRTRNEPTPPLQAGNVVLIGEEKMPRLNWKLGVIDETFMGRDGHIRSCMVRLPDGTKLRRPIQLLYNLEL